LKGKKWRKGRGKASLIKNIHFPFIPSSHQEKKKKHNLEYYKKYREKVLNTNPYYLQPRYKIFGEKKEEKK